MHTQYFFEMETFMKKNTFRMILDTIMAVLLVLMYKKNVLTLTFHEVGGIFVCLLVIIHIMVNRSWIAGITKTFCRKGTPAKQRVLWIVDTLFALDFLAILITGIGVSKKVLPQFAFISGSGIPYHEFFGGIALILLGIHLGLHWKWIKGMFGGNKKENKAVRIIASVVLVAALGFGSYSLAASSVGQWLIGPFGNTQQTAAMHEHGGPGMGNGNGPGIGRGAGIPNGQPITVQGVAVLLVQFACIVVLIATIVAFIEWLITRKRKAAETAQAEK